jgi:hypothetical protein
LGHLRRAGEGAAGSDAGGIAGLIAPLLDDELRDALEADFQQTYHLPLSPGRTYTWRRFGVLVRGLSHDSRFARAVSARHPAPDDGGRADTAAWSLSERLLALAIDHLAIANWQRGGGKSKLSLPFGDADGDGDAPTRRKPRIDLPQDQIRARLAARGPVAEKEEADGW